jgi:hypothetical protein
MEKRQPQVRKNTNLESVLFAVVLQETDPRSTCRKQPRPLRNAPLRPF